MDQHVDSYHSGTVASFTGGTKSEVQRSAATARESITPVALFATALTEKGTRRRGESLRQATCASPDVQNQSDDLLMETVMDGTNKMPGFKKKLNPDKIQQVLAYIRELGQKR